MECAIQRNESISHELKAINHTIKRKFVASVSGAGIDKVTVMHGWIMCYLYDNRHRDIFQKDLETEFCISRSTVTNILNLMEKKGYVERVSVKSDARLKKLILTETGERMNSILKNIMDDNEARINGILSSEEQMIFLKLIRKLRNGLEKC